MVIKKEERRFHVTLHLEGKVERVIRATSEEDALNKVKKMLLSPDGGPKSNMTTAFCWDVEFERCSPSWRDMTGEEREVYFSDIRSKSKSEDTDECIDENQTA